ncbi:MAG TPA: BatA domain-containing protein [Candidatus Dormibacteraeota bacterium]|nr:BatA domain-containing protein [Candidatus Dormibacteraeota bacterium]
MPFSFLNPWLWLGAAAIAAPLWLHLRRKQETNLHLFSAVQFLEDQPQPRQSPLRLRDIVLFLLRALALLLIIGAFTWPYFRGANTAPVKESRVYILDNTMSRQANDGFAKDRDRVLAEFSKAPPDVQLALVELTSSPRTIVSFGDGRETGRERLKSLEPSFQRGSYLAAFRQANSLLANSLGAQKRIVFLGDNQENQWNENVSTPPFLRNVQVDLPPTELSALPNLALAEPRIQRVFLGDKSLINFTVKLTHTGQAPTARISVRSNGQAILNRELDLDKQPESILLQAQWEADPTNWLRGDVTVEGNPDVLAADNKAFFSLPPVQEGKVALLAQSQYLRLALSPEVMRGQWAARILDPSKLADELSTTNDADVLFLESNYLQSGDARKLLSRYLSNGRGVILVVNRTTPAISGCLRELGFEAQAMVTTPPDHPEKFQFILSNHPIFHPFLSPDYGNLMDIKVYKYNRLESSQAMPLVFSEHGAPLFFQGTKLRGRLLVSAFSFDRDHTSWPVHQTFIPFLDLALQAARAEDPTPTTFEPGEVTQYQLPASSAPREVVLRGEDTKEVSRSPVEQGKAQVHLPSRPGLYTLTFDESARVEKMFSVNPSPKESQLAYSPAPEAIKNWQINHPADTPKASASMGKVSMAGILQQRVWWWMLLGGLGALLLETVMAEAFGLRKLKGT